MSTWTGSARSGTAARSRIVGNSGRKMIARLGRVPRRAGLKRVYPTGHGAARGVMLQVSGNNRNVLIFMTVEMSGDKTLSFLPLERLTPRMILGWTAPFLGGIFRLAVGRIGLRRSATRAPDGRLYAR